MRAILSETIRSIGFDDALALASIAAFIAMIGTWAGVFGKAI